MSSFADLNLPTTLDTSTGDLIEDFFVPVLSKAIRYDRGVGFFSSGWLRITAKGMVKFAANGGRGRWVTSPILSEEDWQALQAGDAARYNPILRAALTRNIDDLEDMLEEETLSALAWMVADEVLTFRLALPHNKLEGGEFHDKFGIFIDTEGNHISFNGSYNESIQGTRNYESIKIFREWELAFAPLVQADIQRFEKLWNNQDPNVQVFELPEAAKEQIIKLRSKERPYPKPKWVREQKILENKATYRLSSLWKHQQEAIEAWEQNNRIGIVSMATGSGKTRTAIAAAERCPGLNLLIIAVPHNVLVEQWAEELLIHSSFPNPILVYESSANWQDKLFNKLRAAHETEWSKPVVVIGSMQSLSRVRFQSVIADAEIPSQTLLIVDEVHNVGAATFQKILNSSYQWRLGLSATPIRHFDEVGTATIRRYFRDIVYVYDLAQALQDKLLTPYEYYTYGVELSPSEYKEYLELTNRILSLRGKVVDNEVTFQTNNILDEDTEEIKQLLFQRARILKKCTAKLDIVLNALNSHATQRCLIYCADHEQLDDVHLLLNKNRIVHLNYTSKTSKPQRIAALEALEKGHIPILLAIECLDEGIDVPVVDSAIILASSTNKRQFIQRRGRILRRAKDKGKAILTDVIALPPREVGEQGKWMLKGELARAKEMAELAENRYEALLRIKTFTDPYGVLFTELLTGESNG